ncbi:MAG TPA: Xaa-Pro aminopeptidase [Verrucomicrobiae bacterium]|nr:Xaa-Pro aminopeptidase [Verrucomicrobiae bacterium]
MKNRTEPDAAAAKMFVEHRGRLLKLLPPNALVVVNANDVLPTSADGSMRLHPNSDLFYLAGVEQEQSILLLCPDAEDEKHREILFLREPSRENQLWEGHKLTREEATARSGIANVHWLGEFPRLFHRLMCESEAVFLNSNEHPRAVIEVESRDARFVADTVRRYPLHDFRRLAPLLHQLRALKSEQEIALIRKARDITEAGFRRVAKFLVPGVGEKDVEAEFAHEFIRRGGKFAYGPIIASGMNACCLHYIANDSTCRAGEMLLLDVAASWSNYNSDMTRTLPVSGRFTPRQRKIYNAVLRVLRGSSKNLTAGKKPREWQKEAEQLMEKELVDLHLITTREIKRQDADRPALKKYFMHGIGHSLGLDVHDVTAAALPIQAGWVMTVEPGIYIPEEKMGVRLENNVLVTETGQVDLMARIPIEAEAIEEMMARK